MLSAPSSAVVPFPNADKRSFAQARDSWLKVALADTGLTHGEARLCSALSLHFNFEHYDSTGELIAWPAQETLMAETTLSKTTVCDGINKLESRRLIEVERSRYDHTTKRRARNFYHVPPRYGLPDLALDQGPKPRSETKVRPAGRDSTNRLDDIDSTIKKERKKLGIRERKGRKEGRKQEREDFSSSSVASSLPKIPFPPNSARPPSPLLPGDRWAERYRRQRAEDDATLEQYRMAAAAKNGGGQ